MDWVLQQVALSCWICGWAFQEAQLAVWTALPSLSGLGLALFGPLKAVARNDGATTNCPPHYFRPQPPIMSTNCAILSVLLLLWLLLLLLHVPLRLPWQWSPEATARPHSAEVPGPSQKEVGHCRNLNSLQCCR